MLLLIKSVCYPRGYCCDVWGRKCPLGIAGAWGGSGAGISPWWDVAGPGLVMLDVSWCPALGHDPFLLRT